MVQLTEVEDEHFQNQKEVEYDDDEDFTDTGEFFSHPPDRIVALGA